MPTAGLVTSASRRQNLSSENLTLRWRAAHCRFENWGYPWLSQLDFMQGRHKCSKPGSGFSATCHRGPNIPVNDPVPGPCQVDHTNVENGVYLLRLLLRDSPFPWEEGQGLPSSAQGPKGPLWEKLGWPVLSHLDAGGGTWVLSSGPDSWHQN